MTPPHWEYAASRLFSGGELPIVTVRVYSAIALFARELFATRGGVSEWERVRVDSTG